MKPALKKIIIFVSIVIIVTVVAVLVLGKNNSATNAILQTTNLSTTTTQTEGDQSGKFLQSLSQVKSINLDTTFFKNKSYQKLVDFSLTPVIEDQRLIGRPNPFAPIGSDSVFVPPTNLNDTIDQNAKKIN
ncbi:MAG: hypothetical protein KBB86_00350 [Candidatus Pacebacteria bacterium]|nr:hypothetical protein [Candidatus Paceibacterota bacterium]